MTVVSAELSAGFVIGVTSEPSVEVVSCLLARENPVEAGITLADTADAIVKA